MIGRVFMGAACLTLVVLWIVLTTGLARAQSCLSPPMPILPASRAVVAEYRDILRDDFEYYFRDMQAYFLCLDQERDRAIEDAQNVTDDYRRFLDALAATQGDGS